jgi:hypothetical protein
MNIFFIVLSIEHSSRRMRDVSDFKNQKLRVFVQALYMLFNQDVQIKKSKSN